MLPPPITYDLMHGSSMLAKVIGSTGVLFTDLVGFTKLSASLSSIKLFQILNHIYEKFDRHLETYDVYKVDTIGDGA